MAGLRRCGREAARPDGSAAARPLPAATPGREVSKTPSRAGLRACKCIDRCCFDRLPMRAHSGEWPKRTCLPLRGQRRNRTGFPFNPIARRRRGVTITRRRLHANGTPKRRAQCRAPMHAAQGGFEGRVDHSRSVFVRTSCRLPSSSTDNETSIGRQHTAQSSVYCWAPAEMSATVSKLSPQYGQ